MSSCQTFVYLTRLSRLWALSQAAVCELERGDRDADGLRRAQRMLAEIMAREDRRYGDRLRALRESLGALHAACGEREPDACCELDGSLLCLESEAALLQASAGHRERRAVARVAQAVVAACARLRQRRSAVQSHHLEAV